MGARQWNQRRRAIEAAASAKTHRDEGEKKERAKKKTMRPTRSLCARAGLSSPSPQPLLSLFVVVVAIVPYALFWLHLSVCAMSLLAHSASSRHYIAKKIATTPQPAEKKGNNKIGMFLFQKKKECKHWIGRVWRGDTQQKAGDAAAWVFYLCAVSCCALLHRLLFFLFVLLLLPAASTDSIYAPARSSRQPLFSFSPPRPTLVRPPTRAATSAERKKRRKEKNENAR